MQTHPLDGQSSFDRRFLLFASKRHSCPHYRSIAARLRRWTIRAARRRAVRRRSDSISSTLPCRWTETSPVNPFNREKGINNPSLVGRSLLISKSFQSRTVPFNEGFDLIRKGLFHLTPHDSRVRRRAFLLFTNCRFIGLENVALHRCMIPQSPCEDNARYKLRITPFQASPSEKR